MRKEQSSSKSPRVGVSSTAVTSALSLAEDDYRVMRKSPSAMFRASLGNMLRPLGNEEFTIHDRYNRNDVKVRYHADALGEVNSSVDTIRRDHGISLSPYDVKRIIRAIGGKDARFKKYSKDKEHLKKKKGVLKHINSFNYVNVDYDGHRYRVTVARTEGDKVVTPYHIKLLEDKMP